MKPSSSVFASLIILLCLTGLKPVHPPIEADARILHHVVDLNSSILKLYWQDDQGKNFENLGNLKSWLEKRDQGLVFGMNAGMYMENLEPLGLYVQKGVEMHPMNNTEEGHGNFYMQPNGIFYLTKGRQAQVVQRSEYEDSDEVNYATQSGPMLVINGEMHSAFTEGSKNLNIRNGVGILPDGSVLFAMSKEPINFFDFATFFLDQGCQNALYLDGAISRTYLPSKDWEQLTGKLGVLIGETH